MENPNLELYLEGIYGEEAIQFEGLDYAIVGTTHEGYFVYDYDRMIECFVEDGMTLEDAVEWIDFNVIGINAGKGFVILYSNEQI
jgi:hypothetical protein